MMDIRKHAQLNPLVKDKINALIATEFGCVPIVQKTTWASPDWTIVYYKNEEIAAFYNIIERKIYIDQKEYKAAGINNVITPERYRGEWLCDENIKRNGRFYL